MKIELQLFGAYRQLGEKLELYLPDGARVSDIREALTKQLNSSKLNNPALLKSSRFASEVEILDENEQLIDGAKLAIIPPVAGG